MKSLFTASIVSLSLLTLGTAFADPNRNPYIENINRNNWLGQRGNGFAPLDAPYKKLRPTIGQRQRAESFNPSLRNSQLEAVRKALPTVSPIIPTIALQTPVKSQASRGTCSIFSATAMIEAMLVRTYKIPTTIDLSEQWLQYVSTRFKTSDGSSSWTNFYNIYNYGMPQEQVYPYNPNSWIDVGLTDPDAQKACGHVRPNLLKGCLIAQRNPELYEKSDEELSSQQTGFFDPAFLGARNQANQMKSQMLKNSDPQSSLVALQSAEEVKYYLNKGIPVTLDIDFYFGAWNHRKADQLGIGRNADHWAQGLVFYPVAGSLDAINSKKDPAGHSVLLVGYDDTLEMTKTIKMKDGTEKEVTYKGVYYFKNSWGTANFAVQAQVQGQPIPGYGAITQDYSHDFGEFFRMPLGESPQSNRR